jgi:hypothetical protein
VNLRRGFIRVAIGLVVLWLAFWTCAYVIGQNPSEDLPSPGLALSLPANVILAATGFFLLSWSISGFRPN